MAAGATVYNMSINTISNGPPRSAAGAFTGTPNPGLSVIAVSAPVLARVSARCNVTPSFIPLTEWYVVPAQRYSQSPTAVRR